MAGMRAAGGIERRRERGGGEQQRGQAQDRQARYHHRRHQDRAGQVAGDHHRAARVAVRQAGQEQPADDPRQVPAGVGQGGEQRRPGPVVDQQGDSDQGQPVTRDGQDLREPHGPELADREHAAEGGARRGSALHGDPPGGSQAAGAPWSASASSSPEPRGGENVANLTGTPRLGRMQGGAPGIKRAGSGKSVTSTCRASRIPLGSGRTWCATQPQVTRMIPPPQNRAG